jgi:pectin methylesterase-like acyl-CoA thioesterase
MNYISVIPSTCANAPVKIGPDDYSTIQAAYDAAADGDIIKGRTMTYNETLNMDRAVTVSLVGGYNCDFTEVMGTTTLNGNMNVNNGLVINENFIFE